MPNFNGQLNSNEIFASIFNMIISQEVFADNIFDVKASLVDRARVDGGLYGDTKLYYSTDVLKSYPWGGDAEAANLLALDRPADPEVQAIELNQFRQIRLTVDNYLSKRAWSTENAFSSFNSILLGWIRNTKRIYDSTLYNSFIGTNETTIGEQDIELTIPTLTDNTSAVEQEAHNRLVAQRIAEKMANLLVDLEDVSRNYNDYGNLRSYSGDDFIAVWNSEYANMITKLDLPTIFHKDGMIDKFAEYTLPARYFGQINTGSGNANTPNNTVRSLVEKDYNTVAMNDARYDPKKHIFPGDLLPDGVAYTANETYDEDGTIMFKLIHKRSVPYMSAFEVGTSFFNARSLTENHYLTFGYNTLEHLKNYPFITVRAVEA